MRMHAFILFLRILLPGKWIDSGGYLEVMQPYGIATALNCGALLYMQSLYVHIAVRHSSGIIIIMGMPTHVIA